MTLYLLSTHTDKDKENKKNSVIFSVLVFLDIFHHHFAFFQPLNLCVYLRHWS